MPSRKMIAGRFGFRIILVGFGRLRNIISGESECVGGSANNEENESRKNMKHVEKMVGVEKSASHDKSCWRRA
jgi:hypothetical protein